MLELSNQDILNLDHALINHITTIIGKKKKKKKKERHELMLLQPKLEIHFNFLESKLMKF